MRAPNREIPGVVTQFMLGLASHPPLRGRKTDRGCPKSKIINHLITKGYTKRQARVAIHDGVSILFYLAPFTAAKEYCKEGDNKWVRLTDCRYLNGAVNAAA